MRFSNADTDRAYHFLAECRRDVVGEAVCEAENQDGLSEADYIADELVPTLENQGYMTDDVDMHEIAHVFIDEMGGW
jgi:hypothetical protein